MRSIFIWAATLWVAAGSSPAAAQDYCREFTNTIILHGKPQQAFGTSCLQPDGSWRIVSTGEPRSLGAVPGGYAVAPQPSYPTAHYVPTRHVEPQRVIHEHIYHEPEPSAVRILFNSLHIIGHSSHGYGGHHYDYKRHYKHKRRHYDAHHGYSRRHHWRDDRHSYHKHKHHGRDHGHRKHRGGRDHARRH